jgi:predicted nucleotidyltransferase
MSEELKSPPTLDELRAHRDEIIALADRYGAYNIRVFGSVARGDATPDSDVDLLVSFREHTSLYEMSGLLQDLKELIGRDVSLVSEGGLRERFRKRIQDDITTL